MSHILEKPETGKLRESGSLVGPTNFKYGLVSMQGWRETMEDSHTAILKIDDNQFKDWSFFAVFDGHCGGSVSAHSSKHLLPKIVETEEFKKVNLNDPSHLDDIKAAIRSGFLQVDREMKAIEGTHVTNDRSGSTAICVMISPDKFIIVNCGDSRAVLCRKGEAYLCTVDHKPTVPSERKRIQEAGGTVIFQRINGSLAVSRALGDFEYKGVKGKGETEQLVSPEPEIYVEERKPDEDEFIVLACDGIWDVMTNDEVCEFILHQMTITDDLEKIAAAVVDFCLYKGSRDNMSIVLIAFPAAPKLNPEAVELENKFEDYIRKRTTEILKEDPLAEASRVLQRLNEEENMPDRPQGSTHGSKRSFIESVIKSIRNATSAASSDEISRAVQ